MEFGLDRAWETLSKRQLDRKRFGLVTNAASFSSRFQPSKSFFCKHLNITDLITPKHGIGSFIADGKDIEGQRDAETGIVVHSLYSNGGKPVDPSVSQDIDCLLFDIQDVGLRFYTT